MLRTALRAQTRPVASQRRTFVSTVLLTRSWDNDTVATLRQEAKSRGLSHKGNKATLITRLQQFDQHNPMQHVSSPMTPPSPPVQHTRSAHTTEVPGVPSSAEPPVTIPNFPKYALPLIPDASRPIPQPTAQIPFTPDFWESSRVKAAEQAQEIPEAASPNLIAVAGDASHISASPSHTLFSPLESVTQEPVKSSKDKTFFEALTEDLFIPISLPKLQTEGVNVLQVTQTSGSQVKDHSRTLDKDEKTGLWVLLGVFVGSWVAAGVFQAPSKFAAKAEEVVEEVEGAKAAKH
ncbi:hypothetical protein EUX98_g281 [Antrodiella citrinella]|uniref:SAP domain-containing protein n=1 Tax=Antrodiella citrinella TaxID=2447956 RepID=A0A4V3XJQ2_9APHY|nr:hypothetical protein EUX98_g281 [Antrodiella citrinella]